MQVSRTTPPISPAEANGFVHEGSPLVVIPYTAYMQPDQTVRLSIYSEMSARAAAAVYREAAIDTTTVIALGEHTYGRTHSATTDLIYADMRNHGVPASAWAPDRPQHANTTPQQLAWLAATYKELWQGHRPVLVGHAQHWPRIELLCSIYRIAAVFVDAAAVLGTVGELTPAYRQAMQLYENQNRQYEQQVMRLTEMTAWMRPAVVTTIFKALAKLRSPNVVDMGNTPAVRQTLYTATVRQHIKYVRRHAL